SSPIARQARFVNLDGKVQVKKADSVQWTNADYTVTLDKGDLIQTGPEGVARIAFADGTEYTVQADTLVTVEENNVGQEETKVAVHITSGQVDLNTGGLSAGSKAEVSVENAVADVHSNSRASVTSDPSTQQQQVTVTTGSAELDRGTVRMDIGQSERASFVTGQPDITKTQVLVAPQLVEPLNLAPKFVSDPKTDPVHFSWKPVATAKMYEFQASNTGIFNRLVKDVKTADTSVDVTGFAPGDYFWRVRAIDDKDQLSDPSDAFKFTLAVQGKNQDMLLTIDGTQLEGNSVEVSGRTEPGAILIINGEQVADIDSAGHFRYFTQPMTSGSHTIVITGQNRRGDTTIKRVDIVIP
ncbi:MAG TPA: FecR domain-containing protein, partial [Candidatus Acidoferrales bacterium]